MSEIQYLTGDATKPETDGPTLIAHVCNDVGGWGRGFVLALSRRWRKPELCYRNWFRGGRGEVGESRTSERPALGEVQFVEVEGPFGGDIVVANMIGQHDVRSVAGVPPVRYEAIRTALAKVAEVAGREGRTVVMPKIGAGLAGGEWAVIEKIITEELCAKGVDVEVYLLEGDSPS